MIEKMKLESQDVAAQKREELKQLFPSVFTETKNEKGELVESVDFEKLKAELGEFTFAFEARRERYGTDWPGKKECMNSIQKLSTGTLRPNERKSVDFDKTRNVFIEGDNLESLRLIQKAYYGQVQVVYIDPPYNTGHEFIYPDNYAESLATYLDYAGLVDEDGRRFSSNSTTEGRFHSKWLNMIYPRIYLARNLLTESGSIWISIDDNELQNTLAVCKEIFGEENFVSTFIWEKRTTRENRKVFSINHDYVICFAKNKEAFQLSRNLLPLSEEAKARYSNADDDPRGPWQSVSINAQAGPGRRKEQFYTIVTPSGRSVDPPAGRCWIFTRERLDELIADNRIWFGEDGSNVPRQKTFLSESNNGLTPHTLWTADEIGTTDSAKKHLIKLFDDESLYDTPKPVELIERIIQIATSPESNDIVLDFFAGSGTTGHATLKANLLDGGNRRYLLVQLPEKTAEDSPAFKNGLSRISDVGINRLRSVKKSLQEENALFEKGAANDCDFGFRVFELNESCFLSWRQVTAELPDEEVVKQLELQIDHVDDDATKIEILFELLLKSGFVLDEPYFELTSREARMFSVADGALLICLEDEITQELLDEVVKLEPIQFICLDKAFQGNDQLKANAVQTFSAHNHGRKEADQIIFRTV